MRVERRPCELGEEVSSDHRVGLGTVGEFQFPGLPYGTASFECGSSSCQRKLGRRLGDGVDSEGNSFDLGVVSVLDQFADPSFHEHVTSCLEG